MERTPGAMPRELKSREKLKRSDVLYRNSGSEEIGNVSGVLRYCEV